MTIKVNIQSDRKNREVFAQIDNIKAATERGVRRGFFRAGAIIVKEARRSIIKGPKTGRVYKISGRRRKHRSSAPGEPPANLTGQLQKSTGFLISGSSEMKIGAGGADGIIHAHASKNVKYARRLELGDSKVKARPYLIRAIENKQKDTELAFENGIKELLKA
jgi:hypothetical protein